MKPIVHAESSARIFGGNPEDYLPIHNLMDSSKNCIADNRHRILTHNTWFIGCDGPLERIFGTKIVNSAGREICVRNIGEQHVSEDFHGIIPSVQDYLLHLKYQLWFGGDYRNGKPASAVSNSYGD